VNVSFVSEWTREQVPGPRPQPMTSRHSYCRLPRSPPSSLARSIATISLQNEKQGGRRIRKNCNFARRLGWPSSQRASQEKNCGRWMLNLTVYVQQKP
jgi:hypothetical protein